jgi:flagellar M-ring protein FliF
MGIPGALSNRVPPVPTLTETPPPANGAAAGTAAPGTGATSESYNRQFQYGREVAVTRSASGTIRRLTVAVALANPAGGRPRGTAEINAIRSLVQGAVGFDAARGDVVTVSARGFAPGVDSDAAASWMDSPWIATGGRAGAALLVILALFFLIIRPMLRAAAARREAEALTPPLLGSPLPEAEVRATPAELDSIMGAANWTQRAALVRDFAAQHPDASTQVIHDLLRQKEGADRG